MDAKMPTEGMETVWQFLKVSYEPIILLPDIYTQEMKTRISTKIGTYMSTAQWQKCGGKWKCSPAGKG